MIYTNEKFDTVSQIVNSYKETWGKEMEPIQLVEHIAEAYCIDNMIRGEQARQIVKRAIQNMISFKCITYDLKIADVVYTDGWKHDPSIDNEYPLLDKIAKSL